MNLNPTLGSEINKTRPAVVLSTNRLAKLPVRLIVPLTKWQSRFASRNTLVHIKSAPANGLTNDSAADPMQMRCVALERFTGRLGMLTADEIAEIALGVAICVEYQP